MTELIYLSDPYIREYETAVTSITQKKGEALVTLRETVFYPYGGGQPSDTGLIIAKNGSLEVTQVSYNNGNPIHRGLLSGKMSVGEKVTCRINWERRYQNMQVHSAGHIIHEALRILNPGLIPLKGDHGKHSYISYQGTLTQKDIGPKVQDLANKIIGQDLEITSKFVALDELKKFVPDLPENLPTNKELRVIQIGDFPPTPDGGTQVAKTGEVPPIVISNVETPTANNPVIHYQLNRQELSEISTAESALTTQPGQPPIPDEILSLKNNTLALIAQASAPEELEQIRLSLLGKDGQITLFLKKLPQMSPETKKTYGSAVNATKSAIESALVDRKSLLQTNRSQTRLDLTLPGTPISVGLLHPISAVAREINEIFLAQGFSVADGPELETDEYNYDRLNLPKDHPARDLQDSLYIKEPEILLRTHTSSVEAHILAERKPPYRFVFPGKCYRYENVNASNHMMFYQYQGLAIGFNITLANLKAVFATFVKMYYGPDEKMRFRCKYYPEVEPGVGVDISCPFCQQKGCSVCKFRGWIEISGAGMVHPNMLRRVNLDPEKYSGFAFGMGLDRLAMTRYGINDIRALFNGDLVYKI